MHVLGIVGPDAADLASALAPRLDGRVATVERTTDAPEAPSVEGASATYALGTDGRWAATGDERTADDLLDDLAPSYDHALLVGTPDVRVPTVVLGGGDGDAAGEVLLEAPSADAVDLADLRDRLAETEPHVTLETLVDRIKASPYADRAGAIATFTGRVRAKDAPDDSPTEFLEFEKYGGVAEERMDEISGELTEREGVQEVLMHHRTGRIDAGEDIVFVVVLAGHREEAFRTVRDGIDRLKDEVPIFKKERTTDEEFWVHEA